MIPLALCVGIMAVIFWIANNHYPIIRFIFKHANPKDVIDACDDILENNPDPQSDEYRIAMELKLRLEKEARK